MCDFSLMHAKSRPAKVADKLVTKNFGMGTIGFASEEEANNLAHDSTAVCVLPGTEIAFGKDVKMLSPMECPKSRVARFRQIDKDTKLTHHDALEFACGLIVKLTHIVEGQLATVLQLPAAPKNVEEAKEQERLEVVG